MLSVQFQEVLAMWLGIFTGPKVILVTDPQVPPKFYKVGCFPYAMHGAGIAYVIF